MFRKKTQRDIVERILIDNFNGLVKPLNMHDIELVDKFKDGTFGFSFLGIMLYANGYNVRGESSGHKNGLIYYDGSTIFGIGFFKKTLSEKEGHLHIIAPRGGDYFQAVDNFIKKFRQLSPVSKASIYIRHLSQQHYTIFINNGYLGIASDPWDAIAPSEDETYCNRFIYLNDIISYDKNNELRPKVLEGFESKDFRRKAKMAYNRFNNFLNLNKLHFRIEPYHYKQHGKEAEGVVVDHFKTLKNKVGSSTEDYFNLIRFSPKVHQENFFACIGYLSGTNEDIPIMLFIGEKISSDTVALYATFASRNNKEVGQRYDMRGFSAISQYSYIRIFDILKRQGIESVDLGGSEIEDLNRFKKQLGAKEIKTFWAICP